MAWCHELGGAYSDDVTHSSGPRFAGRTGRCEIPPPSAPEECYTTQQDASPGVPSGVNWYAYYLLGTTSCLIVHADDPMRGVRSCSALSRQ